MKKLTPMMEQYLSIKEKYQDSIMFFRLGDFYEMFFDDALTASRELEITLTQRDCGMEEKAPMCGVPHHVSEPYIAKLVEKGYKVAICEQVEDPALAKGIVRRDVVKVVTPGTIMDTKVLDEKKNNFLVSIYLDEFGGGLSYVDNSTGQLYTTEISRSLKDNYVFILNELGKLNPSEIICNRKFLNEKKYINIIKNKFNTYLNVYDEVDISQTGENVKKLFKKNNLDLKISKKIYSKFATEKLIEYLYNTEKNDLNHINELNYYQASKYMALDINTRSNLEIHETIITKSKKGSLLGVIDTTSTSMGGRLLKNWLDQPLLDRKTIEERLDIVEYFYNNIMFLDDIDNYLKGIYDIERLATKVSNGNCNPRDLISLKNSISEIPMLKKTLTSCSCIKLKELGEKIDDLSDIHVLLDLSIIDNPPINIKEGNIIKGGYNEELDKLKSASKDGKVWLMELEQREREKTGIKNLKVKYNKVIGYYIEITKSNLSNVPEYYIRKQTLTNADKILGADERALNLEYRIFQEIRDNIKAHISRVQILAKIISTIDVLACFSKVAHKYDYVRPTLNEKGNINILEGRHPVVEVSLKDSMFIPNDTNLNLKDSMVHIITGPNMAGKSTYMRQVAIITLLAQIGSFVPAKEANISIVDRIFTRIGASDNLASGESTFMVEMKEVSDIIRDASRKSLIILDEVGRGTSTYDGLSIAWAVVEHMVKNIRAKTLFATHYHELTQLEDKYPSIKNMTIAAEQKGDDIVFLRKIIDGSTNKSYGIQVAKLAGINGDIISRANDILTSIEGAHKLDLNGSKVESEKQLSLGDYKKDYFIERIQNINIENISPMDAFSILNNLIKDASSLK